MGKIILYTTLNVVGCVFGALVFYKRRQSNRAKKTSKINSRLMTIKKGGIDQESTELLTSEGELALKPVATNELSKIVEIVLQNNEGEVLTFTRPDVVSDVKYQELLNGHPQQDLLPVFDYAKTIDKLLEQAPYGLFKTITNPKDLSKFADGTLCTMKRDAEDNLVEYAGLKGIEELSKENLLSSINLGLQSKATISGQHYLNKITSQLDEMETNFEKLVAFHLDEKAAVLQNANIRLNEIIQKTKFDTTDIDEIRDLHNKIGEVFQDYKIRLDRKSKEVAQFNPKVFFVQKRVDYYKKEISELNLMVHICFRADRLKRQAELAEIAVRMKLNYLDPMIGDLFNNLKNNYKNSFSFSIDNYIEKTFKLININAKRIVSSGTDFIFIDRNRDKLLKSISDEADTLKKQLSCKEVSNIVNIALTERNEEKEFLIQPDEDFNAERIFIPLIETYTN